MATAADLCKYTRTKENLKGAFAYERKNNLAYRKWYQGNISHSRRCERELQAEQDKSDL